ncbi:MAG: enterobactin exporter EntS [Candidatus Methanofastidiosum methylothiophilum]|uniref:Enterobactin exporter EntS n=1 Tax=Candidatus Methanofastidiosum methylothiophilum TaxID=1705564 RepID=A0A150IIX5_9EURY|nr:MAG: enterobactin exporter EntS [Candidatus Methanofastidiosum methylthiophilus]
MNFSDTFRSLKNKNYRIFYIGQGISLIGTWMQQVATSWLIYRLTGSAIALGVSTFLSQIPALIFSPIAGTYIDKMNKLTIVKLMQFLMMIVAFLLGVFTLTEIITVKLVYILYCILGILNAIEIPARQSMFVELIDKKEDLPNAIALNSSLFNAARLVGPSIAGLLLLKISEGYCFIINAISFLFVLFSLFAVKVSKKEVSLENHNILNSLKEGFNFIMKTADVSYPILLLAIFSLFGISFTTILPVIAVKMYSGASNILGFLMSSLGLGALASTLMLASRRNFDNMKKTIIISSIIFAFSLIIFSFSKLFIIGIIVIFIAGGSMVLQNSSTNAMVQSKTGDNMRGRVMGFYTFAFRGIMPFGSLIIGFLTEKISASGALIICGSICLAASIFIGTRLFILKRFN